MAKLSTDELLDAFKEMTLIELSEFVKQFEETFEVTAAAPVALAGPATTAAPVEAEAEKDSFDVVLEGDGGLDVEDVLELLHEVRQLDKRHFLERVEQLVGAELRHVWQPFLAFK